MNLVVPQCKFSFDTNILGFGLYIDDFFEKGELKVKAQEGNLNNGFCRLLCHQSPIIKHFIKGIDSQTARFAYLIHRERGGSRIPRPLGRG